MFLIRFLSNNPPPVTDYREAASGSYRVMRGGAWTCDADLIVVGYRNANPPDGEYNEVGFRAVMTD
jgi:formylglycine-generating enzyme required for sulfatase activity